MNNLNPKNILGFKNVLLTLISIMLFSLSTSLQANNNISQIDPAKFSVKFSQTPIHQAFEMLSKLGDVDILLAKEVTGDISANLKNTNIDKAIHAVASISGFSAEREGNTYTIVNHEQYGKDTLIDGKQVKTLKVQYIDPTIAETLLTKYLSRHGSITLIAKRNLLVIEDKPDFIEKLEKILVQVDLKPRQIIIEAKILEITLQDDEVLGIDWSKQSSKTTLGTTGLSSIGSTGFFLNYLNDDLDLSLQALTENGRIKTLSTPKLMVLEDQEAEVIIGDRIGFKVTTTVNSVTTETIEFIDSGVILKVQAAVDNNGQIMLDIHPEVSSGSITAGIPNISTTEVSTQMIAKSGESIFIGGLMKNKTTDIKSGIPGLSKIPLLGGLFSRNQETLINTETIVIIKPHLIENHASGVHGDSIRRYRNIGSELELTNAASYSTKKKKLRHQKASPLK